MADKAVMLDRSSSDAQNDKILTVVFLKTHFAGHWQAGSNDDQTALTYNSSRVVESPRVLRRLQLLRE
jgi:hypothetical protein